MNMVKMSKHWLLNKQEQTQKKSLGNFRGIFFEHLRLMEYKPYAAYWFFPLYSKGNRL